MFLLNSVKSLVLIQSGNAFHCLAEKYEKELRPKLVVLGLQRDKMLLPPSFTFIHLHTRVYLHTRATFTIILNMKQIMQHGCYSNYHFLVDFGPVSCIQVLINEIIHHTHKM